MNVHTGLITIKLPDTHDRLSAADGTGVLKQGFPPEFFTSIVEQLSRQIPRIPLLPFSGVTINGDLFTRRKKFRNFYRVIS
jgi:hypothetical protein